MKIEKGTVSWKPECTFKDFEIYSNVSDKKYWIQNFYFLIPGHSARFTCRIISLTACTVTWYHENVELKQSVKFMKKYIGDDYTFIINRAKVFIFIFQKNNF